MIKNQTVYQGRIVLKFEKYPHYTSISDGVLNKIHLDLGFTKLVSRIMPTKLSKTTSKMILNKEKVHLIETKTGGFIRDYKIEDPFLSHSTNPEIFYLYDSFVTADGNYIGDATIGWFYYKNNFKVCQDYPIGVAEIYDNEKLEAYYGFTHRGGAPFYIGDKLFEETYIPKEEDFEEWEWAGFEYDMNNSDSDDKNICDYIPFRKRGSKIIETLEEAKRAAINLSEYLS